MASLNSKTGCLNSISINPVVPWVLFDEYDALQKLGKALKLSKAVKVYKITLVDSGLNLKVLGKDKRSDAETTDLKWFSTTRRFPTPLDFQFLDLSKVENTLTLEIKCKEDYSKKKQIEEEKAKSENSKSTKNNKRKQEETYQPKEKSSPPRKKIVILPGGSTQETILNNPPTEENNEPTPSGSGTIRKPGPKNN